MDELLNQQTLVKGKIAQFESNYNKDGSNRKTKRYLETKIEQLKALYTEYLRTDEQIYKFVPQIDKNHEYTNERATVASTYKKLIEEMRQLLNNGPPLTPTLPRKEDFRLPEADVFDEISEPKTKIPTESTNSTLNQLLRRQDFKIREIYKDIAKAKDVLELQQGKQAIQVTLQCIQRAMNQIIDRHEELCVEASDEDHERLGYFARGDYEAVKDEYTSIVIQMSTALEETPSNNKITAEMNLKPIEIPTFHGDYMKWNSFAEIFKRLIDKNQKLSDTHKINYLKNHLSGAAARLIGHLETTADNYNTAWHILNNRYNNKRLIITAHLSTLLNQPSINVESAVAIRNLHDTTNECIHAIRSMGINVESWNSFLIFILSKKLDNETRRLYESSLQNPAEFQETGEFLKFLEQRFKSLEASCITKNQSQQAKTPMVKQSFAAITLRDICVFCQMNHTLEQCARFKQLSTTDKNQIALLHYLCRRCLSPTHQTYRCTQNKKCGICNGIHHTILHTANNKPQTTSTGEVKNVKLVTNVSIDKEHVLLATAMVRSTNLNGNCVTLRVLIDPGSQATFITEEAVQRLQLKGQKVFAKIAGVGGHTIGEVKKIVNLKIQPVTNSEFELHLDALVFQNLTKLLPEQQIQTKGWEHINNLEHADPNYNTPGSIDMLLGADYYPKIVLGDIRKGSPEHPIAQKTELGWIVFGKFKSANAQHYIKTMTSYVDLEEQLKRFWEIEEVDLKREVTSDEQRCEEHFLNNYKRLENGAYQVALPFKDNEFTLGESRKKATARFLQVEKQLNKNIQMKNEYESFIDEYIHLDHMTEINQLEDTSRHYFLPHHAVIKDDSSTTKLRVVFDASAKTSNGISLNDLLHTGPTIQQALVEILLRWRKHQYVFKADIEKMFRQIKIQPQDQNYQLIRWRNKKGTISMYKLKTVTYGTASATYLATRVLHQLSQDDGNIYPAAKRAVAEDFYVDDILSGADTIEQAVAMQEQLSKLLRQGGFNLRKWSSNSHKILENIDTGHRNENDHTIEIGEAIKTLGIIWNPTEDIFQFKIKPLDNEAPITKRKVLSETSKLFDPIGWFAPVIIKAKIIMQQLWTLGLDWDAQLPTELEAKWICYTNQLKSLETIKLQRWLSHNTENTGELHGFCDASEDAYAAVIYYKANTTSNQNKVILVTAKTKVAPLKSKLTIPRLELCAAVLLSKLIKKTKQALQEPDIKTFAWTDSMITLAWIKGKPNRFKTFVANRVVEIQSTLPTMRWGYVKSEENPADCASRGLNPNGLKDHMLWWNGPTWLRDSFEYVQQPQIEETTEESRNDVCAFATTSEDENVILKLIERCSSFTKAVRSIAYVLRFTRRLVKSSPSYLTTRELQDSLKLALKVVQQNAFGPFDKQLGKQSELKIRTLNPKIGNEGLLRVGGRLSNARVSYDIQHPTIIPYKGHFTTLLIDYAHKMTLHGSKSLTLAFIRQRYWIIKGPLAVKTFINKCVICYRQQARSMNQLMGDLPTARVNPTRPFTHTGVDYAGPFYLRYSPGRGNKTYKGYLAVFVCFAIKAVHLEVVSNLSSEAFLAAFKRFTARRGHCSDLYSDCGSNFIGASKLMKNDMITALKQLPENLAAQLANDGTHWHYIPPKAPHMGGLWEAAVKSVKHHLRRIIGEQHLTFEEMTTIICQIEACLNSRPLIPLSSDPNDFSTLTPGHFLIGEPLRMVPEPNHLNRGINHLTRWRLLQKITQEYWRIWLTEYLLLLQKRGKWNKNEPNIAKGQLVLIKDDELPPGKWPLGRIYEVHSGKDGFIRTVTVKTSKGGLLKRPITKISRLPIEDSEQCEKIPLPEKAQTRAAAANDSTKQQSRVTRASTKSKMLLHTFTIICALGIALAGPPTRCNISRFNTHPGIYFDKVGQGSLMNGEWRIITYYNLTSYSAELDHLGNAAHQLGILCSNGTLLTPAHTDTFKYCEAIVSQIKSLHVELNEKNDILNALGGNKITRKRRAPFDFVGTIANELFGVLDQREGKKYRESIENLKANQQHHQELLQDQMLILESTINVMKHTYEETNKKFEAYNQILTTILFHEEFTDLAIHTMLEMMKLRNFQTAIISTITEVHQGILDPLILTPHQLQELINQIITNLKLDQAIPYRREDIAAIYKTATVKTLKLEATVIFEIKIPLIQRTRYNIYHIMPVPTIHQQEYIYIKPSSDYLLIAIEGNQYMQLSSDELNTCTNLNDEYICNIHQPLNAYHSNTSSCEMQLFQQTSNVPSNCEIHKMDITSLWIPLRQHNAWIFVIKAKVLYNVICESGSGAIEATTIFIEGEGILSLDPSCVLKGDTVTLTGFRTFSSKVEHSFVPQFNLSDKLNMDPTIGANRSPQVNSAIEAIEESISHHKRELRTSTAINVHDFHHYTISYTIIAILLIAAAIIYVKHKGKPRVAGADPLPEA